MERERQERQEHRAETQADRQRSRSTNAGDQLRDWEEFFQSLEEKHDARMIMPGGRR